MSREKQIEEMAEYIFGNAITHDTQFKEDCRSIAIDLYNAGYRKQEWISVDERLPTKNEKVLVYCGGVIDTDWICSQGIWYYHEHHTITHWMPLPEAPKMKGGAE